MRYHDLSNYKVRQAGIVDFTQIPTIIDPSATINYLSATGSKIVGISVLHFIFICFVSKTKLAIPDDNKRYSECITIL